MRPRFALPAKLAIVAVAVLLGCGGQSDRDLHPREDPFTVRPFGPISGGGWIGNAICYGPHRDGQRPGGLTPSTEQIREDLHLLIGHWNLLRIYGSSEFADTLLTVIRDDDLDMKVLLGAWIAPNAEITNCTEIDAAIRLANAFPDIVIAVSVGNETQVSWSAHRSSADVLIRHVRRARASVDIPVTVADDFSYWNKRESRLLAREIDFITMHAHPMWNGMQLTDAMAWLGARVTEVGQVHPDRGLVIGETGWATAASHRGEQAELINGRPGEAEQMGFFRDVLVWCNSERLPVFFFEAFDENWKGGSDPTDVEKHWGLFRANRTAKKAIETSCGP